MLIDELRLCNKIHYFGLGFIQIKIGPSLRYHFYTKLIEPTCEPEEIHNHRYNFTSTVLAGRLTQEVYWVNFLPHAVTGCWWSRQVSCDPAIQSPAEIRPVIARLLSIQGMAAGSVYSTAYQTYHKVEAEEGTITRVTTKERRTNLAEVVSTNRELRCPFSRAIPETRLWEIVAAKLEEAGL